MSYSLYIDLEVTGRYLAKFFINSLSKPTAVNCSGVKTIWSSAPYSPLPSTQPTELCSEKEEGEGGRRRRKEEEEGGGGRRKIRKKRMLFFHWNVVPRHKALCH
jgi:hypothetical protein